MVIVLLGVLLKNLGTRKGQECKCGATALRAMVRKTHLDEFGESLVDENEGDQEGEDLLSKTGNEADQDASLKGHGDKNNQHQPEPDPDTARQVLDVVIFAELQALNRLARERLATADSEQRKSPMHKKKKVLDRSWTTHKTIIEEEKSTVIRGTVE